MALLRAVCAQSGAMTALRVVVSSGRMCLAKPLASNSLHRVLPLRPSSNLRCKSRPFLGSPLPFLAKPVGAPRSFSVASVVRSEFEVVPEGKPDTLEFRIFVKDKEGRTVSPWHDIPLKAGNGLFNFVCEIPKETRAKMEVATDEANTPIKQDVKKGKLRLYPYNIHWNYGMLPQTWEDPTHAKEEVDGALGDNDPVDVVEIGSRRATMGEVYPVKPVAVLAMIDEGELDWKVVAIAADDPKADLVNDVVDMEQHFPGVLKAVREWFRDYKVPDGKPQNKFGFNDEPQSAVYAKGVIEETHGFWGNLVRRSTPAGELSLV